MSTLIVAVGSLSRPKLEAAKDALRELAPRLAPGATYIVVGLDVPSGVAATPRSREEVMAGARNRALALLERARARQEPWSYCAGLEAGLDAILENGRREVFLVSWAYVCDLEGRGYFGQAGGVAVPQALAASVLNHGEDLSVAIEAFSGRSGVRDSEGAWGVLTGNLLTRRDAFRIALLHAFAPFANAALYGRE
jgi:non-canonical (house-cleaning) NTP pyrophosphatase